MNKMPYEIKRKLRSLAISCQKSGSLEIEVVKMIEKYGVDCDYLSANSDPYDGKPHTEALAYIVNAEGGTESSIDEIEEVFLEHIKININVTLQEKRRILNG